MNIDLLRELEGVVLDFYEKKKMMGVSFFDRSFRSINRSQTSGIID